MEGIIFIGIQASGKSAFYKEKFFNTHLRISMDMLNTRNKESQLLDKCIELHQRVVIDNTNPTKADRKRYINQFKANKYKVIAYYFQSKVKQSIARNDNRVGKEKIPQAGILSTYNRMELPSAKEGYDEMFYVQIVNNQFITKEWKNEV